MPLLQGPTLALSGGGFRSTLFQIGTLTRLNELGLLPRIVCASSVSGGSIANGYLAAQWANLVFTDSVATNFSERFAKPLIDFCSKSIDVPSVLSGFINPFKHMGDELVEALDEHLFGKSTLQDLPNAKSGEVPRFVFNATSMQSGVRFWFSKEDAGDYRIGVTKAPRISLARAVAASSAFPPFFAPLVVDLKGMRFESAKDLSGGKDISDLLNQAAFHTAALLADGGTYDNMALEAVWNRYDTIWVSDAGSPFEASDDVSRDWIREMMRIIDLMMRAGEAERRRVLLDRFKDAKRGNQAGSAGAYWGIATQIAHYGTPGALPCAPEKTAPLARIGTRLAGFSEAQTCQLVNWGYALADAALRWNGILQGPAPRWPFQNFSLE